MTSPNRRFNPGCPSWITRKFLLWFLQADIIENSYSFITHMLLSMHVHFLIITYIHISCIFSELVSQCVSIRMTQFFYILTYSIHVKVYCYCLILNCYCPIVTVLTLNCYCPTVTIQLLLSRHWTVTVKMLLSSHWTVTVQPLLSRHWIVTVQLLLSEHSSDF